MALNNLITASVGLFIAIILVCLFLLIFIIYTLFHQYKRKKWGWFWATLLLTILSGIGVLTAIIYWVIYLSKK